VLQIGISYDKEFVELYESIPKKLLDIEGIGKQLNIDYASKKFFKGTNVADSSIDSNANIDDLNMTTYKTEINKPYDKLNGLYLIWKRAKKLYGTKEADKILKLEFYGNLYYNDSTGVNFPYCYNYSTMDLATGGLPMVSKIKCDPPKHLSAFIGQLVNFMSIASNNTLGATGLADLLIVAAWYVDRRVTPYSINEIKQELQSFIFTANQPFRGGVQSSFTNISIYDDYFLDNLIPGYIFFDGTTPKKDTVKLLQQIFLELMNETMEKTLFTFPVTTACFSVDDDLNIEDLDFLKQVTEVNKKFGFINFYAGKTSTLSSCCRLRSETDNEFFNMFGAGSTKIGSASVCTVNLPRLLVEGELEDVVTSALKVNHVRRSIIKDRIDAGLLPLYSHGFMALHTQYSTIGLVGIYEYINMKEFSVSEYTKSATELLDKIHLITDKWSKKYGYPVNIEQVPAETAGIKLAQKDRVLGKLDKQLYSNQFLPLTMEADMLDRIEIQGKLDKLFSGGSILHLNVEQPIENANDEAELIKYSVKKGVVYFARNSNIQRCAEGHIGVGKRTNCSICSEPIVDNFTRVVGFLTNTKNWNVVRREVDYPNRKFYKTIDNDYDI